MKKIDLTKGNVLTVLVSLSLPIMGSSLLQFTYNIIDMFWVGKLGSDALASVGSSGLFLSLGYAINSLVVVGSGIKISHSIGENNIKKTKQYTNAALILSFIIPLTYSFIIILFGKNLIGILDIDNAKVVSDGYIYLAISGIMLFFSFNNILYTRILSCYGNTKLPLIISFIGISINIILDPILIYVLELGVFGAALATLISTVITFVIFNIKCRQILHYRKDIGFCRVKAKEILSLGLPMAFQRILFTFVNIALAKIVAQFGSEAIAAQKLGLQIESITYMVIGGLSGAMSSFVGQNYGIKDYNRIKSGYHTALSIGCIYNIIVGLIFIFSPELLIKLFLDDSNTVIIASSYLRIVGFSQVFSSVEMISNGMFTGLGLPKIPAIISIIFTILRIPMAILLSTFFGVNGIWLSIAISSILKGICSFGTYRFKVWRKLKHA